LITVKRPPLGAPLEVVQKDGEETSRGKAMSEGLLGIRETVKVELSE